MADVIGKNTPNSAKLMGYVSEIERVNAAIKDLQDSRTAMYANAKSEGFVPAAIRYVVRARKMKPHDRQEAETTRDIYMHAAGMDIEPPLHRQVEAMAEESVGGERLLEVYMLLVPPSSDMIVTIAGKRVRVWRDKDGKARSEDYMPPEPAQFSQNRTTTLPPAPKRDVPICNADQAEELGAQAGRDNKPVIENPFPYADERRARWDLGWRRGSGNDGMGPG